MEKMAGKMIFGVGPEIGNLAGFGVGCVSEPLERRAEVTKHNGRE